MKKLITIIALASIALVACGGGDSCGEGMHEELGSPVMTPIFTGKTVNYMITYPFARCEVDK